MALQTLGPIDQTYVFFVCVLDFWISIWWVVFNLCCSCCRNMCVCIYIYIYMCVCAHKINKYIYIYIYIYIVEREIFFFYILKFALFFLPFCFVCCLLLLLLLLLLLFFLFSKFHVCSTRCWIYMITFISETGVMLDMVHFYFGDVLEVQTSNCEIQRGFNVYFCSVDRHAWIINI